MSSSAHGVATSRYQLPSATHVGRVKLQVSDLDRSLRFYDRVLGLKVLERRNGSVLLGSDLPLLELIERRGARSAPTHGALGLYHFAILLPDRASLGRLLRHLSELGIHAGMSDHFVSEALYLQDPDNLGIEVYADRPRTEWRAERGQITMRTVPLDVHAVLDAGGDEPWNGAPSGTRIGHIHLHVGDIDDAAAFYHQALGLDKTAWNYPGALFLSAGGYHHHLGVNTWARGATSAAESDARLIEWELVVPATNDVDATATSLERNSYRIERDGTDVVARDPWGTQLRIITPGSRRQN